MQTQLLGGRALNIHEDPIAAGNRSRNMRMPGYCICGGG